MDRIRANNKYIPVKYKEIIPLLYEIIRFFTAFLTITRN